MNYGELKTAVLSDSHRPDLSGEVARFIREAEGMIRRELRAFPVTGTLDEDDRVSGGVYTLPSGVLEVRAIYRADEQGNAIEQVSLAAIRRMSTSATVLQYAVKGSTIEFRGVPGTDDEFDIEYLGHPAALSADEDTNDLLDQNETLYKEGALVYLFKHTQDLELEQGALDTFNDVLEKLNEQLGRKLGGASVAPAYNFCGGSSY
ncbi:MAG: hypothetical protein WD795_16375 [Woeseia sp.]